MNFFGLLPSGRLKMPFSFETIADISSPKALREVKQVKNYVIRPKSDGEHDLLAANSTGKLLILTKIDKNGIQWVVKLIHGDHVGRQVANCVDAADFHMLPCHQKKHVDGPRYSFIYEFHASQAMHVFELVRYEPDIGGNWQPVESAIVGHFQQRNDIVREWADRGQTRVRLIKYGEESGGQVIV